MSQRAAILPRQAPANQVHRLARWKNLLVVLIPSLQAADLEASKLFDAIKKSKPFANTARGFFYSKKFLQAFVASQWPADDSRNHSNCDEVFVVPPQSLSGIF